MRLNIGLIFWRHLAPSDWLWAYNVGPFSMGLSTHKKYQKIGIDARPEYQKTRYYASKKSQKEMMKFKNAT